MKKIITLITLICFSFSLVACQNMTKQDAGVIAGGALGGLVGSRFGGGNGQVLATVGGAIIGAAIGGLIGHNMDQTDQLEMQQALENNKNNQSTSWKNPNNGNTYQVVPKQTYYESNGTPCREYYMNATIGGKPQQVWGKACRQADGSWKVVS